MKHKLILAVSTMMLFSTPVYAAGSDSSDSASTTNSNWYVMAEEAVKAKDFGQAVTLLDKVLANDSSNANAWNYLAYSHRKLGDLNKAEAEYKKALIINSEHTGAHEYLGELYVETGRLHLAVQLLERLKNICGTDCEEYEALEIVINDSKGS
jgi:Flp pilus assembly protein TadD